MVRASDPNCGAGDVAPVQWMLLVVGLIATIVVTVYVTRVARKAMREAVQAAPDDASASEPPA